MLQRQFSLKLCLYLLALLFFIPVIPNFPKNTLDLSWSWTLIYGLLHHYQFSKDIVFTFGPLSFVFTNFYVPKVYPYLIVLRTLFALSLFYMLFCFLDLVARPKISFFLGLVSIYLIAGTLASGYDVLSMFYCQLLLIWYLIFVKDNREIDFKRWFFMSLGCWNLAVALLIKFNLFPVVLFTLLLLTLIAIFYQRKLPWILIGFIFCFLFLSFITYQPLSGLVAFMHNNLDVVMGYSGAMSITERRTVFLIIAYLIFTLIEVIGIRYLRISLAEKYYISSLTLMVNFFVFKESFVRADTHVFLAIQFAFVGLVFMLILFLRLGLTKKSPWLLCSPIMGMILLVIMTLISKNHFFSVWKYPLDNLANIPTYFRQDFVQRYQQQVQSIQHECNLPTISGTVDIYSFDQACVLAGQFAYQPRPIFQSYSAYTSRLLELNRDYLLGTQAPDNIFFALQSIDMRYPSSEDSISWPVLLTYYHFKAMVGPYAWLVKQTSPASTITSKLVAAQTYHMNEQVAVPPTFRNQYLWMQISLTPTISSRLLSWLYKPAIVYIDVTFVNGKQARYRLVDGITARGFLFSPLVSTTKQFTLLFSAKGRSQLLASSKVTSFKIYYLGHFNFLDSSEYQIKYFTFNFNS